MPELVSGESYLNLSVPKFQFSVAKTRRAPLFVLYLTDREPKDSPTCLNHTGLFFSLLFFFFFSLLSSSLHILFLYCFSSVSPFTQEQTNKTTKVLEEQQQQTKTKTKPNKGERKEKKRKEPKDKKTLLCHITHYITKK